MFTRPHLSPVRSEDADIDLKAYILFISDNNMFMVLLIFHRISHFKNKYLLELSTNPPPLSVSLDTAKSPPVPL